MTAPETKTIYIVWTNTDLTEGRGYQYPIAFCETERTAIRVAQKKGVMGSSADVQPFQAVKYMGRWCAPFSLTEATDADKKEQAQADLRLQAIKRAKAAGLTDADIQLLRL